MKRYIEYDQYTIGYEIEGDCDGNHAIIKSVTHECGLTSDLVMFDKETQADIKFHCEEAFANLQTEAYLKRGELLDC